MSTRIERRMNRAQVERRRRLDALLHHLFHSDGPRTTRQLADAVGCSAHTAWDDLRTLHRQGLVDRDPGPGKAASWVLA